MRLVVLMLALASAFAGMVLAEQGNALPAELDPTDAALFI